MSRDAAFVLHGPEGSRLYSRRPALKWIGEGSACTAPGCRAQRFVVRVSETDHSGLDSPAEFRACGIEPDEETIAGYWRCVMLFPTLTPHEGEITMAEVLLDGIPVLEHTPTPAPAATQGALFSEE